MSQFVDRMGSKMCCCSTAFSSAAATKGGVISPHLAPEDKSRALQLPRAGSQFITNRRISCD